jgi:clan AA aspartic protease (TIGR02281 family)
MGDGTSADHSAAARLAKLAADKGDSTGQFLLAMCFELGAGVPKDGGEAQRLYKLSAGQGNASAQKALQRLSGQAAPAQRTVSVSSLAVALRRQGGVLMVPAVLNETVTANFVVDSGASDVVIPENVVQALRKAGKLTDADFTGNQMVKLADGSIVKSRTFVLRSFAVNNRVLENIRASVAPGGAMPLLGQSFLQRFSSWSIDNEHQVLLLREKQ